MSTIQNSYLESLGALQSPFSSAIGYQVTNNSQTSSYLFSMDSQVNSKGSYNWDIWEVGFNGSLLAKSSTYSGDNFSYFYDVLRTIQITNSPNPSSSKAPSSKTLLFGHSTDYDEQNDGYYTFTYWINSDGNLEKEASSTYWKNSCHNVATFEIDGTTYLWAQTNKSENDSYLWNIYEISSSGELSDSIASGSWEYCYDTISFFTTYTKGDNEDYTPLVYFYASSSNVNVENNSYYWCVTPVTYSSKNKEFFASEATYDGFTKTLYQPGVFLQNPITGNRFMFMIAKDSTDNLYPWEVIQLTNSSNINSSADSGATTLIKPTVSSSGSAFIDYTTFTAIPTTGLTYLFASTDIANSKDEYFYTIQTIMQGGELSPSSITTAYLQEMILYSSKTNAYSNISDSLALVDLDAGDAVKYAKEVNAEQRNLKDYTSSWITKYSDDVYNTLSIYQDNEADLADYLEDANDAINKTISAFNSSINIDVSNTKGDTLTAEKWVSECVTQVNNSIDNFNQANISSTETLIGLIDDITLLLTKFQDTQESFSKDLADYQKDVYETATTLGNIYSEIYTIEYGSLTDKKVKSQLSELKTSLSNQEEELKNVQKEIIKQTIKLNSIISIGGQESYKEGLNLYRIVMAEEFESEIFAEYFVVLLVLIAFTIYYEIETIDLIKSLIKRQEKLAKEIQDEKEEIAGITKEVPAMHVLASISNNFSENVINVANSLINNTTSLNDIQSTLQSASKEIRYINSISEIQIIDWLNSSSKKYPSVNYNPDSKLTNSDCTDWSAKINSYLKMYVAATPTHIAGTIWALKTACQQANSLVAMPKTTYYQTTLSKFEQENKS